MDQSSYSASESERPKRRDEDTEWTSKATREIDNGLEQQLRDLAQVTGITDRGALLALLEAAKFDLSVRPYHLIGQITPVSRAPLPGVVALAAYMSLHPGCAPIPQR